jgi:MOSC domain-containing protein YiiM
MIGKLIGIARRKASREPMELLSSVNIIEDWGLEGNGPRPAKYADDHVTLLSREAWETALSVVGSPDLPWTTRRANLLVEGMNFPSGIGSVLMIGPVILEVIGETTPCALMDHFYRGLRLALAEDWRGGLTCRAVEGGAISLGDEVRVTIDEPLRQRVLP